MGRAFTPRSYNPDIVRHTGSGWGRVAGFTAAPSVRIAILAPALDAGQSGAPAGGASSGEGTRRYKHRPSKRCGPYPENANKNSEWDSEYER
jgi:hypothetical protein